RLGFGDQTFGDWGWRVPFLISAILVGLSIYIRLKLEESPLYARLKEQGKSSHNPALESFSSGKNWGLILFALFGATAPEGVVWYTGQFYALFYLGTVVKISYVTLYIIMMVALTLGAPFFIVFGGLRPSPAAPIAAYTGMPLSGPFYPMAIAAIGVVVSLSFLREPYHQVKIWDEVGGAPPLVPDQP